MVAALKCGRGCHSFAGVTAAFFWAGQMGKTTAATFADNLNELLGWMAARLPGGWEVSLTMTGDNSGGGEVSLSLIDPDGDEFDFGCHEGDIRETLVEHVNQAMACAAADAGQEPPECVDWWPQA